MRYPRLAMLTLAVVLLGALGARAEARTSGPAEPTVSCDRIVLRDRSGAEDGFRILLGAVSVPGSRLLAHGSTTTPNGHWRFYRRAGIAIRAGTSVVSVTVPVGWRDRVAISWGGSPASSSLALRALRPLAGGSVERVLRRLPPPHERRLRTVARHRRRHEHDGPCGHRPRLRRSA